MRRTSRYAAFNQQNSDGGRLDGIYVGTTTRLPPTAPVATDYERLRLEYDYDSFGNVKTLREGFNNNTPITYTFSYDAHNRLSQAFGQNYTYDSSGRLTGYEGASFDYAAKPVHAVNTVGGVDRYDYDLNGNMTIRDKGLSTQQTLTWDHENRLASLTATGLSESYLYDDAGIRVKKTSNGTTAYYPFPHYEVSGSTITKYYFFNGQRVAMKVGSTLTYLHPDHLGSTVLATDSSGIIVTNQGYRGYGKYRLGGTLPTDHRYTGQKLDTATGLMYYGARYYDRQVGTFISPDTLVPDPTNLWDYNRFMYARGNPLKYSDPTGHAPQYPGDPDPDNAACSTDWCWQNRWFEAHGYRWNDAARDWQGNHTAYFYDNAIRNDVFAEAGIVQQGAWTDPELDLMAQGLVALYRQVGSMERLTGLFGGSVWLQRTADALAPLFPDCVGMAACMVLGRVVQVYDRTFASTANFARGTVVHELAHVIDAQSGQSLSARMPLISDLTEYARVAGGVEYFAEAVVDWVYGLRYKPADTRRRVLDPLQVGYLEFELR